MEKYFLNFVDCQKPRVLITGATGYLGSHIASIINKYHKKSYVIRMITSNAENIDKFKSSFPVHDFEWVEADLSDGEDVKRAFRGCKYVIHTVNPGVPELSQKHTGADQMRNWNAETLKWTKNILNACDDYKI